MANIIYDLLVVMKLILNQFHGVHSVEEDYMLKINKNLLICTKTNMILTAPIYHTIIAAILVIYIMRCISLSAFNPVPIFLLAFSMILFKSEFEKQGTIERYLVRAFRRAEKPSDK